VKNFGLDISWVTEVNDEAILALKDSLMNYAALESLELNFSYLTNLTDSALIPLFASFKELSGLKSFKFDGFSLKNIMDPGLKAFGEFIERLKLLEKLYLKVGESSKFSIAPPHEEFGCLVSALKNKPNLRELNFRIYDFRSTFSDKNILEFCSAVAQMENLETVLFGLAGSPMTQYSQEAIDELARNLKGLRKLKTVELSFEGRSLVQVNLTKFLNDTKKIPNVKIIA